MQEAFTGCRPETLPNPQREQVAGHSREPLTHAEAEFARELFERHRTSLQHYLMSLLRTREDAQDILQETYLRLLRQPSLDHVRENARAYLYQTATNLARDLFRQRRRRNVSADAGEFHSSDLDGPDWVSGPDLALQADQLHAVIIRAVEELDAQMRVALLLHRFRDLTHRQIALQMGVSERTIERYIKHGLAHIASRLREAS